MSFNPLFIGSKDATRSMLSRQPEFAFQSPFHRVKGCNRVGLSATGGSDSKFQSPFHRVKGCNGGMKNASFFRRSSFNPLFIGSKDATLQTAIICSTTPKFQSPFHRVKGCNPRGGSACAVCIRRFNPLFIGSKDAT